VQKVAFLRIGRFSLFEELSQIGVFEDALEQKVGWKDVSNSDLIKGLILFLSELVAQLSIQAMPNDRFGRSFPE
jgi:hypothetical protein